MRIKFILTLTILTVFLSSGCKSVKVASASEEISVLPPSYSFRDSSVSNPGGAPVNWRTFFQDQNLVRLIDTALSGNFDLKIAAQRILQSQAGVHATEGPLRPAVQGIGSAGVRRFGLYTMDGAGNATTDILPGKLVPPNLPDFMLGFQASWEIDLWYKLRNMKAAALARFHASVESGKLAQTAIVAGIAEAYFNLQALDEQIRVLDQYIEIQENSLALTQIQKNTGVTNELAVRQFQNQLLELRGNRLQLEQQITELESLVNVLVGRFPQPVARSPLFMSGSLPPVDAGVPSSLLINRPDIRMAEYELVAAKADLRVARAYFYPSFNIGALIGTQAFRPDFLVSKPASVTYNLLGGVMAPLINKRSIKAGYSRANSYQTEALAVYNQTVITAFSEVYNHLNVIKNLEKQFAYKDEQVKTIESGAEIAGDLMRTGRISYLEVLSARQNALETRLGLVEIRTRQWLSSIGLYRSLGGGWQ